MARIHKTSVPRHVISVRDRERLRALARDQIATSMRIEGRTFPSADVEDSEDQTRPRSRSQA